MTTKILSEGVQHIEDLDIKRFIDTVRNIGMMHASERLDGVRIWVGLEADGKFFTSRPGATTPSDRYYSEADFPYFAANNGLRAAHMAFASKESDIRAILSNGDIVEAEVMYGRQPNNVTYGLDGKNFIAITNGAENTNDIKADQLAGVLQNQEVSVKTIIVDTQDGVNLDRKAITQTFRFVGSQKVNPEVMQNLGLEKELQKLQAYLDNESGVQGFSNFELMSTSLGSIPVEEREHAKSQKEQILSTVKMKFKLPMKKKMLAKILSKVKPGLRGQDVSNDEDVDLEGVILKDPNTGELISIADKDNFNAVNQFNFAVRNQIAGLVRTTEEDAPLESRGGITGMMKIRIADLLGNRDLALSREAKKIFDANRGDDAPSTLRNVAKTLNGSEDFQGTKRKVMSVVAATVDELTSMLERFKKNKDDPENTYHLKLRNGKTIGLSEEVVKRTLLTFAEAKRNLLELHQNIHDANTFEQLVAVLYGRAAKQVHSAEAEEIAESTESLNEDGSLLLETRMYTDKARYKAVPDSWTLLNIYVATIMMAVLMYKANDKRGIRLVKDKPHYRMTKWTAEMSAVNFWGYAVWKSGSPTVSKLTTKKIASETFKVIRKVPAAWIKFLHMDLSFGKDVPIDWQDHYKTLRFMIQHAPGLSMDRVNTLLKSAFDYETLSYDEKVKFLPKLYFYVMQFVPTSPLITRLRAIQNELLGSEKETPIVMTKGQKLLGEDGEIAPGPEAGPAATAQSSSSSMSASTNMGAVSSKDVRIGKFRIVKRKRNPDVKRKKFERPKENDE